MVEFGIKGKKMNMVDERVEIEEIEGMKKIYERLIEDLFG